jgi:hypothetical protein
MTDEMRLVLIHEEPFHTTPLHVAINYRNEAALATMLDAGANWRFRTRRGVTPLQHAVLFGTAAMVRKLLTLQPLNRQVLLGDTTMTDLVVMAVQECSTEYDPDWTWLDEDDPDGAAGDDPDWPAGWVDRIRRREFFRERAANVDFLLTATRGLWTPAELQGWLREAEEPFVPEVIEVVHQHLRWEPRRRWMTAVTAARAFAHTSEKSPA